MHWANSPYLQQLDIPNISKIINNFLGDDVTMKRVKKSDIVALIKRVFKEVTSNKDHKMPDIATVEVNSIYIEVFFKKNFKLPMSDCDFSDYYYFQKKLCYYTGGNLEVLKPYNNVTKSIIIQCNYNIDFEE